MGLRILDSGCCETFKAGIHGAALGLAVVMGAYNAAAWLRRRQRHLAVNALLYGAVVLWEQRHVARHLAAREAQRETLPQKPLQSAPARPRLVPDPVPLSADDQEPARERVAV